MEQEEKIRKPRIVRLYKHFANYWLTDASFGLQLLILIFTAFALPILIEYGHVEMLFVNLVFLFLFFTGIFSARERFLIFLTSGLFFTQLGLRLLRFSDLPVEFYLMERIVGILNMSVFIFLNIRLLFRDNEVNVYRVIGAINVYLSLAILGAFVFEIIHLNIGSSIAGELVLSGIDEDFSNYMYFSLVSLTTVGFGDLYPANIMSKMLAGFLSTVGILYPAVVIARLVGSTRK
ncbi:potassium channel family protein [Algoriphagus sp. CAU 1675]|uniref:potassium channel family protein n=1 Tax=Algoriphagus sp. CAU 1675 TaxID=3032597 RepID=UPI0023DA2140|nr:potassium channel family protein [Algoriphagus sp. CAU 1675]MDF2157839.1 potassium channel family protein [Algoriphagus sp. CAU 1675]